MKPVKPRTSQSAQQPSCFGRDNEGAAKEGLSLHSQTVQAVSEEYCTRRRQFKKAKLRWRVSHGSKRALGWIPVKAVALRYKSGQVHYQGVSLSLWDSFGLKDFPLRSGGFCEDARGRDTNAAKNLLARGWALMADLGFCQIAIAGEAKPLKLQ